MAELILPTARARGARRGPKLRADDPTVGAHQIRPAALAGAAQCQGWDIRNASVAFTLKAPVQGARLDHRRPGHVIHLDGPSKDRVVVGEGSYDRKGR